MFFSGSSHTDASNGKFNDYGNQVNVHNKGPVSIQISFSFSLFGPSAREPQLRHERNDKLLRTFDPGIHSLSRVDTCCRSPDTIVTIENTLRLMARTTELLTNFGVPPNGDLVQELRLSQQTLILTQFAIEGYGEGPLGQSLANTTTPAVERYHAILLDLSDTVSGTWLNSIKICDMQGSIWRNWRCGNELASLQSQLCQVRRSLSEVLIALKSQVSLFCTPFHPLTFRAMLMQCVMELGNKLRSGHVSLEQLHTSLRDNLPTLSNGIKVHKVRVLDHLGKIIPMPIVFCSTWKDFHHIINGFCQDRFGSRLIERGDYEVVDGEDSQTSFGSLDRIMNTDISP